MCVNFIMRGGFQFLLHMFTKIDKTVNLEHNIRTSKCLQNIVTLM